MSVKMSNPWKRVEHIGDATLYLGDCLEILPHIGEVDAVVTDPPFGVNYKSGRKGRLKRSIEGDHSVELRDSILAIDKPTACFATWRCVPPRAPKGQLIWDKGLAAGMGDLRFPWKPNYEVVWIFGDGWSGKRTTSVLSGETIPTWNSGAFKRLHPHQKPVGVLAEIVGKAPGNVVLDPFMGSGTTGIACSLLNKKFVGIELDEEYFKIACERILSARAQKDLFT